MLGDKEADRDAATAGAALAAAAQGVQILRVHDVRLVRDALLAFEACGGIDGDAARSLARAARRTALTAARASSELSVDPQLLALTQLALFNDTYACMATVAQPPPPNPPTWPPTAATSPSARRPRAVQMATLPAGVKIAWLRRAAELLRRERRRPSSKPTPKTSPPRPATASRPPRSIACGSRPTGIEAIAAALEEVAALRDPIGRVIDSTIRPNGLRIDKVRVPLGVVFFIYESRPNVTADAAAICVKAGNAVILRGGKEAMHSSRAIVELLQQAAARDRPARATPCNW